MKKGDHQMDNEIPEITQLVADYLQAYIQNLNTDEYVGVMLTSFGQFISINSLKIGHIGSKLILFKGISICNNAPIELLQHITQVNLQLSLIKRGGPPEPKRPIGF